MGLIRWLSGKGEKRTVELVGASAIRRQSFVRSLGETSRGAGQVRGNGTLALTDDELVFCLLVPRRDLRIPRSAITQVDTTRTHLGKWVGRKLLRVTWTTPEGETDSIALETRDLDGWLAALGA